MSGHGTGVVLPWRAKAIRDPCRVGKKRSWKRDLLAQGWNETLRTNWARVPMLCRRSHRSEMVAILKLSHLVTWAIAFGRPTFAAPARPDAYALHRKGEGRGGWTSCSTGTLQIQIGRYFRETNLIFHRSYYLDIIIDLIWTLIPFAV